MRLLTLTDVKLPVGTPESKLFEIATKKLKCPPKHFVIKKKSIDARNKADIRILYTLEVGDKKLQQNQAPLSQLPKEKLPQKPVLIVGSGPAGLFCAIRLIQRGFQPIVIERGASIEEREKINENFFLTGKLDKDTNIQFGEGGAGTFSDGKLNTQTHSPLNSEVLKTFAQFGAPEEIVYLNKPHIGSDRLKGVIKNMRQFILERGGQVWFNATLTDIFTEEGTLKAVKIIRKNGGEESLDVSALVLAIGHSSRDTFEMLLRRGVYITQKDFAVGVRIEHLQKSISFAQYGKKYPLLPPADYKLVSHAGERACFTFCMCPGGYVMPATSEEECVVTNGMSCFARDGVNANSALIAQVRKEDFASNHPLAGIEFQRALERKTYLVGGKNYFAPVQRVEDFLKDKTSSNFGEVLPTYKRGTTFADFRQIFPSFITESLKQGLMDMDKKLKGFAHPDALLTATETRTSSPIRIERDKITLQSLSTSNLYPTGEGAGYAGGITSSASDGIRVAEQIYHTFLN